MLKKLIALTFLVIVVIGCTPEGTEQSAELPPAETTSESAVSPVEEAVDNEEAADPNAPEGGQTEILNPDVTAVAPAGSVDLSELTPEPVTEGGDLIVQPAPGVPNPEIKMTQLASQALADRLGIDIGEITLVEAISREWPDSSLGCPSPDLLYAAVITPGYQITLEAGDETYVYHTDTAENVVLCIDGQPAE